MNILILTQCFPPVVGGIENMMGSMALALQEGGHTVTVLADGAPDPAEKSRPYRIERFSAWKPVRRWCKAHEAARLVRTGAYDRIIADTWKSVENLGIDTVPVTVLAHGMEFPTAPSPRKAQRILAAMAKAKDVIANSSFTASLAAPYVAAGRLRTVTPTVPAQAAADPDRLAALRASHGEGLQVVTLCRLEPRKGVDRLIEAVAALHPAYPGLTLHVAGDGADRARLEALARDAGIAGAVIFHGRVPDAEKAALLEFADVFAMPARREGNSVEGFGLVYLEAAWYGVPSLAGREGGAADAVHDGETGLLCDGADPASVTAALDRLLGDRDFRLRLGENAARHARQQTWQHKIEDFLMPPPEGKTTAGPRVLQLLPALGDGGVERSAVEMAGHLGALGLPNWIASAGGPLVAAAEAAGARHVTLPVGKKSPFSAISAARAVARLVDAEGIDIIHARSRVPAWVGLLARRLARRPVHFVTTFHGVYSHGNALKRFYNSAMLRVPLVIANSGFIRDHIVAVYGFPQARVVVAPRGVEPDLFDPARAPAETRSALRSELGATEIGPLVVMVGRVTRWKGHAVLLEAAARLDRPDLRLAFVGGGSDALVAELQRDIARLGLDGRVTFTGSRRDIPAVLAAADLAVSASTDPEAFGRAAIEAQAMGTPVIATDHGGSRETVLPGRTGWLVPPGDAAALAAALEEALSDPGRLKAMGANGREHVLANFTTRQMLEKEFSAYERLMAEPRR
ncbi:glycosyltransferase [Shinella granuli]|uniref:Glycosyltransferase involved in cell wall biosynthesis n=1 Tax=Shinella granuli TaxID=323621 RepID=A0A4R2D469_SHIGR|nr:glycosyltransferase [Shinella granuli]TCN48446.1 glycosyltransferase involved in cell wall biosynthesis [Shinella granuli]